MSQIIDEVVDKIMRQVRAGEERDPGRRIVNLSFTLTEPDQVKVGPQIFALFEQRLREYFQGADITAKGYAASGYNVIAKVVR